MSSTLDLTLTDALQAFVDENSGDGTNYATPNEFICELLRKHMQQLEVKAIRNAILEGYQDAIDGKSHEFKRDLASLLKRVI